MCTCMYLYIGGKNSFATFNRTNVITWLTFKLRYFHIFLDKNNTQEEHTHTHIHTPEMGVRKTKKTDRKFYSASKNQRGAKKNSSYVCVVKAFYDFTFLVWIHSNCNIIVLMYDFSMTNVLFSHSGNNHVSPLRVLRLYPCMPTYLICEFYYFFTRLPAYFPL